MNVEVVKVSAPYKFALVFKFYAQHLPILEVQRELSNWGVYGSANISVIDHRHILLNFSIEVDFMKIYTRERWVMKGQAIKVFRWSPWFRPGTESDVASIWISLPTLPQCYYKPGL